MKKLITGLMFFILLLTSVSCNSADEDLPYFPVQKAGLGQMEALLEGELMEDNGYLRIKNPYDNYLLIWTHGFSLRTKEDEILIIDGKGKTVAHAGDIITVGGGEAPVKMVESAIGQKLPEDCEGPFWIVGNLVEASQPSENAPDKYAEIFEKYKDNPELIDAAIYAEEEGISMDEAIRRFELMNKAGPYGAELEENEAETLAGFWIQHEPEFGLIAAFIRDGKETIEKYREKYPELVAITEVVEMNYTLKELLEAHAEANHLLEGLGLFYSSATMIKTNQVEIYVTDSDLFYSTFEESGDKLPECVVPIIIYEPLEGVPEGLNPDPSVHFPQLKMASGSYMEALFTGKLELLDGYLRVNETIIIWQPDYFVHNNNGKIEIWDRDGKVVGSVGEEIVMGGGNAGTIEQINPTLKEPLPPDIEGPFWLQGEGTRLSLNFFSDLFSLEVITSGEDKVYFLKRKPLLDETARQKITLTGSLVASYNGVLIRNPLILVEAKPEENKGMVIYTVFWPADYEARIENGVFEILDGSGKVVLRDGEEADIAGKVIYSYFPELSDELPGGYTGPYLIVDEIFRGEE